jgi:hypothetical protein
MNAFKLSFASFDDIGLTVMGIMRGGGFSGTSIVITAEEVGPFA